MSNVLTVRDVHAGYGEENILHGVNLTVERGEIVAVIGPNGSGKSTLLKAVYGLAKVRKGEIVLHAEDGAAVSLVGRRASAVTALGVNMVPQVANVFADMSVRENLEMGSLPIRSRFREQFARVIGALPPLEGMLHKRAATLSGGQRQMLAFGRALMSDPKLLILDEPAAGLAPMVQEEVFQRVKDVNAIGVSILMVEQKARQCLAIADRGYVLEQGRNRIEDTAAALLANPEVARLYLGAGSHARAAV